MPCSTDCSWLISSGSYLDARRLIAYCFDLATACSYDFSRCLWRSSLTPDVSHVVACRFRKGFPEPGRSHFLARHPWICSLEPCRSAEALRPGHSSFVACRPWKCSLEPCRSSAAFDLRLSAVGTGLFACHACRPCFVACRAWKRSFEPCRFSEAFDLCLAAVCAWLFARPSRRLRFHCHHHGWN